MRHTGHVQNGIMRRFCPSFSGHLGSLLQSHLADCVCEMQWPSEIMCSKVILLIGGHRLTNASKTYVVTSQVRSLIMVVCANGLREMECAVACANVDQ
jgi:hypothetical protein